MTSSEWIELLQLIPEDQHNKVIFVLQNGLEINIDIMLRAEESFLVFRGRASGSTEDGRVFFLPFSQITCAYLNRYVKETEIAEMFGEELAIAKPQAELSSDEEAPTEPAAVAVAPAPPAPKAPANPKAPAAPKAPATVKMATPIAPLALLAQAANGVKLKDTGILERLRAQRAGQSQAR